MFLGVINSTYKKVKDEGEDYLENAEIGGNERKLEGIKPANSDKNFQV